MEALTKTQKRRQGEVERLSVAQLSTTLDKALLSQGTAELAFMYLIDRYEFDLDVLKAKLIAKGLDISFSRVKYERIAPFVGLEPGMCLRDAPTYKIHRARLPDDFFEAIIGDLEIAMKHYGPPNDHANGVVRSRFLAPVFN